MYSTLPPTFQPKYSNTVNGTTNATGDSNVHNVATNNVPTNDESRRLIGSQIYNDKTPLEDNVVVPGQENISVENVCPRVGPLELYDDAVIETTPDAHATSHGNGALVISYEQYRAANFNRDTAYREQAHQHAIRAIALCCILLNVCLKEQIFAVSQIGQSPHFPPSDAAFIA